MNNMNMQNNFQNNANNNANNNININNNNNTNFNNNQNNNVQNNNNNQNNNDNQQEMKSVLPRNIEIGTNEIHIENEYRRNLKFDTSTGVRVIISVSKEITVAQALKEFVKKLGLSEDVIGKDLIFLFNGSQLDYKSQDLVKTLPDMAAITVFDQNNVIGAKNILY